jgi:hypothetical protein
MDGSVATVVRSPRNRAHVTNDPRRLASNCDKRTHDGRLFGDLYDSVAAEFPGADGLKVRQVALLRYELEKARAAGTLTLEDVVRVDHAIEKRERALRLALRQRQAEPSSAGGMRATLSRRYGGKAGSAP